MSRYFEPTDFLPWEELYATAEYAPHVGFAMVAGSFACMHPFMFMAGVVTAMGALKAAGATYDYATCQLQSGSNKEGTDGSTMGVCEWFPTAFSGGMTEDTTDDEANRNKNKNTIASSVRGKPGDEEESVPNLAEATSACSTTASTIADSLDEETNNTPNNNKVLHEPVITAPSVPAVIQSPSKIQHQATSETLDPTEWVKDYYPSLSTVALDNVEFRGLKAKEFFDVFFADDAPFGFPAFHKLRRDKEVQYGSWKTGLSSENFYVDNSNRDIDIELPPTMVTKERNVEYHAKTNSFLGPAYAPTKKIQRAYFVSKKMLVVDIKMTLNDIPFSKHFYLIERWIVDGTRSSNNNINNSSNNSNAKSPGKDRKKPKQASSSHCVYVTVSSQVFFTQVCSFEAAITKESAKQVCEISKCWNLMAQDGLKRTEEARMKRLRQKELEEQEQVLGGEQRGLSTGTNNKFNNDESIEIEHIDSPVSYGKNNGPKNSRRRNIIRLRRNSFSHLPSSNNDQPQHNRPLRHRSLSRTFTKLLSRSSSGNSIDESPEKGVSSFHPNVRISAAGVPSV
eukprot:jgi/Psemu1/225538/e_gw1.1625.7.1